MRFIPRIDIKSDYVIKSIRYDGLRNLGQPEVFAKKYYEDGATEIILIDTVSSLYRRRPSFATIKKVSNEISIPLTFCGGLKTLRDAEQAFESGADKIALNTILFENENLISEVAEKFGQQSVIVSIEAKRTECDSWECYTYNGRERTYIDVIDWAKKVEFLGAGEIYISSVDYDGTYLGCDIELAEKLVSILKIPVVVASGVGSINDIKKLLEFTKPSGISVGSALHYGKIRLQDVCNEVCFG